MTNRRKAATMRAKTKLNLKPREMFLVERIEKAEKQQARPSTKEKMMGVIAALRIHRGSLRD